MGINLERAYPIKALFWSTAIFSLFVSACIRVIKWRYGWKPLYIAELRWFPGRMSLKLVTFLKFSQKILEIAMFYWHLLETWVKILNFFSRFQLNRWFHQKFCQSFYKKQLFSLYFNDIFLLKHPNLMVYNGFQLHLYFMTLIQ